MGSTAFQSGLAAGNEVAVAKLTKAKKRDEESI
jgi:hypothetical protein